MGKEDNTVQHSTFEETPSKPIKNTVALIVLIVKGTQLMGVSFKTIN